jgi:hypothetical protein
MESNGLAEGALRSIQQLLDDGNIPRGTFADEQVQNLVAMYNQRGDALIGARDALEKTHKVLADLAGHMHIDYSDECVVLCRDTVRPALSTINEALK